MIQLDGADVPLAPAFGSMLDVALDWSGRLGWPVFPCDPVTKHPLVPRDRDPVTGEPIDGTGGLKKATCDLDQIQAWWRKYPDAMIGLLTGGSVSAFVLEIDVADKKGVVYTTVEVQIAAVEAELGVSLPPTMRVRTPRGGEHWFYWSDCGYPHNSASIKRAGKKLLGIDIRGTGGYVIGAGSVRHDGKAYVLIDDHDIALAPVELVDWACARGRWAQTQAPSPESVITTVAAERVEKGIGDGSARRRNAPQEVCERWAGTALRENSAELATTKPGRRNDLTNIIAFRMGRMVPAGWVAEKTIIDALFAACEANGLVEDHGADQVHATIASGLEAGKRKPLRGLPDRPWRPWRPMDGNDDTPWLRGLRSEIRALYRMRFPSYSAIIDEADCRLWQIIKITADPWIIGQELRLTFEEYQRLAREPHGRKRGPRLPGKMKPSDASREVVETFLQERHREQDRKYRANKRAKEKAAQAAINDLDDKESAILTFLQTYPGQHSVKDLERGVRRSRAFKGMKAADSRKNAIRRLVDPPKGKLSALTPFIDVTRGTAKNHGLKLLVEIRNDAV